MHSVSHRSTDARRVGALVLVALAVNGSLACRREAWRQPQIAPGINPSAVRRVSVGATPQQVVAILGPPIRVRDGNEHGVIYDYALPGIALKNVGLWIYFENNAVTEVYAKQYGWIAEDRVVYALRAGQPVLETADFDPLFTR